MHPFFCRREWRFGKIWSPLFSRSQRICANGSGANAHFEISRLSSCGNLDDKIFNTFHSMLVRNCNFLIITCLLKLFRCLGGEEGEQRYLKTGKISICSNILRSKGNIFSTCNESCCRIWAQGLCDNRNKNSTPTTLSLISLCIE